MPIMRQGNWVYMMGSTNGKALYTGVTNDIYRRVSEHKSGRLEGFTKKYKCHSLLYYEELPSMRCAIEREKYIKGLLRTKKEAMIAAINPMRTDLAADWFSDSEQSD